jgi:hypothetical protein
MSLPACLEPNMRVVNKRYFSFVGEPWWEIEYVHNNMSRTVWVPRLSKWTYFIRAKSKPNIFWIIREVLLMSKIKLFPLSAIRRVSNLSICLTIHMPKQQLIIPWV